MKVTFLGGPSDGAETLLDNPLPPTIRARGPEEDLIAEVVAEPHEMLPGTSATYHLVHVGERGALYAVAFNPTIPEDVVWDHDEMERLRPPGDLFDRPL